MNDMQEKIKSLYVMPILREPVKDFRKPLAPDDMVLIPITTYAGMSKLHESSNSFAFIWGAMFALGVIILFFG